MAAMLDNTLVKADVCLAAAGDPTLLATDLADYLVRKGMPFRKAHHVVGAVVALAEQKARPLNELSFAELRAVDKTFEKDVLDTFDLTAAMKRRELTGAPGVKQVAAQLKRWRKTLE
jgi:argininosuccinate lyase